jgi:hypothetical protein
MKTIGSILACLIVAAALSMASPVRASEVNCASVAACGFGTLVDTKTGTLTVSKGDKVTFTERVYRNSHTGLFTYVFTVDNFGRAPLASVNTLAAAGGDHFDVSGKYGVITGATSSAYTSAAFEFDPSNLTVCFESSSAGCSDSLARGTHFTFYAQSANAPQDGQFLVTGSGPTAGSFALDPTSEPRAFVFLGITLLFLAVAIPFAVRRWRTHGA